MHKLFFDCETGGVDPNVHSLLTAYFCVTDENLNFIDDLYLQLKPSDLSKLVVTKEALDITGINMDEHLSDPATITYEEGVKKLITFLEKNKIKGKRRSFQPAGHNVEFDKNMIWAQLIDKAEWEKLVHYRTLDTFTGCAILQDAGLLPKDIGSLTSLVEYFKIPMKQAHNAKGDIQMNIEVYRAITNLLKMSKSNISKTTTNNSLLEIVEA